MQIIEYFEDGKKECWIEKIGSCDWGAAKYLAVLLKDGRFETVLGTGGKLFLLCDGDKLVSFVTLTHQDLSLIHIFHIRERIQQDAAHL